MSEPVIPEEISWRALTVPDGHRAVAIVFEHPKKICTQARKNIKEECESIMRTTELQGVPVLVLCEDMQMKVVSVPEGYLEETNNGTTRKANTVVAKTAT